MRNWSLVFFTLSTQSAVGLVWVNVASRWFGEGTPAEILTIPLIAALIVSGFGLLMALAHLSKPHLAPHALRNIGFSWLSREVLLVQTFIGAVLLLILVSLLNVTGWIIVFEAAVCLLGGAAIFAMISVYQLKTVPGWNSPATCLEFAGSAMLLGGTLGIVVTALSGNSQPGSNSVAIIATITITLGLILKISAIRPALAAEKVARNKTWYDSKATSHSTGGILAVRLGLNLTGLVLALAAISWVGSAWLWSILSLASFCAGEVMGRRCFYLSYRRLGL